MGQYYLTIRRPYLFLCRDTQFLWIKTMIFDVYFECSWRRENNGGDWQP